MSDEISALGTYGGLGSAGAYSAYDPTMMMSMMGGGYGNYMANPMMSTMINPMMMGGYGMGMGTMNMSNYMDQYFELLNKYNDASEKIKERQLEHGIEMHRRAQFAEVANLSAHDQAFFEKAVVDGDVQEGIREIHDAIRRGDMDNVVQKFFQLKQEIYNKFSEYFMSDEGNINTEEKVKRYICILYSEIAGSYASSNGIKPDLKADILAYGESPFQHGFNKTFLGNSGHNQLNAEQALNQMFGTRINDEGSKINAEKIGTYTATGLEVGAAAAVGSILGATTWGLGRMILPNKLGWGKFAWEHNLAKKFDLKRLPGVAKLCGIGLGIIDILWQMGRD